MLKKNLSSCALINRRFGTRAIPTSPVPEYDAVAIKLLRQKYEISQASLASILNISLATIKHWELDLKKPGGAASKLLDLLDRKGLDVLY